MISQRKDTPKKTTDRRAAGEFRTPFKGTVEVEEGFGLCFEAQACNISEGGMLLCTTYLPEVEQLVTCHVELPGQKGFLANGKVVWRKERDRGGEFGLQFDELSPGGVEAVRVLTETTGESKKSSEREPQMGTAVRLHIEGLPTAMRARIKEALGVQWTIGSELGFLQLGRCLTIEPAETEGTKRIARIENVEVEINPETSTPQLIVRVSLTPPPPPSPTIQRNTHVQDEKEEDEIPTMPSSVRPVSHHGEAFNSPEEHLSSPVNNSVKGGSPSSLSPSSSIWQVPSIPIQAGHISRLMQHALTCIQSSSGSLWRGARALFIPPPPATIRSPSRRVTAPPPGGGISARGKTTLRQQSSYSYSHYEPPKIERGVRVSQRWVIVGGLGIGAIALATFALRSPSTPPLPPPATTPLLSQNAVLPGDSSPSSSETNPSTTPSTFAVQVQPTLEPTPTEEESYRKEIVTTAPLTAPPSHSFTYTGLSATKMKGPQLLPSPLKKKFTTDKHISVPSFGVGPINHANVLRLRLDSTIEKLQGTTKQGGFNVFIPNCRALEPAGPLASQDGRIQSIRILNQPHGAELFVTFKNREIPPYQVRGKEHILEIALAQPFNAAPTLEEKAISIDRPIKESSPPPISKVKPSKKMKVGEKKH
ncbi:PilZ domain-containing protein [Pajaroellobacter abortibovis]|uniref:PilZ domain-containing protein n=1 Tax=Pajaroellobacter abortibovis TaxID=1882918 RepID=A0A1L6MZ76_9BACT|nr:PilZ domain-containing protein [Pajaroellobacter abortibovis]APS00799.1 hypothetical protein BCY86_08995 [Pajaroellobacter abortibovis]